MMEEEKTVGRLPEIVKIGGYLVAGGALVGFSAGLYLLLNRTLFSFLVGMYPYEIMTFFLGVFIPSFVVLIVVGYLFATILRLRKTDLPSILPFVALSLLSLALSALSILYFVSFIGGLLILAASVKAYTRPSFKGLSSREAFFMVELGTVFVASFSLLFLLMGVLDSVFETYGMGSFVSYSPYALLSVGGLSLLLFFLIPRLGSDGTNAGVSGGLGLVMSILSYLFVVQNRFSLFNASAYLGMLVLIAGFGSALFGELLYVKLFFFEPTASFSVPDSSILYEGKYCPYCGKPRQTAVQKECSNCGRSLMWNPYAPFCSSCGRLVSADLDACPHCREDIRNKRSYYQLKVASDQAIVDKLEVESKNMETWHRKGLLRTSRTLRRILSIDSVRSMLDRLNLTLKDGVVILILTYLFGFISLVGYVRRERGTLGNNEIISLFYGLPLECLQVQIWVQPVFVHDIIIFWLAFVIDILLYFAAAFALVSGIAKWRR